MDFDDLDDCEAALGPTPDERRAEMLAGARPEKQEFPFPVGLNFGEAGRMKMLFLHGGGTNSIVGDLQVKNSFAQVKSTTEENSKDMMSWDHFQAPHKIPLTWHGEEAMQEMLRPYGANGFGLYFDRIPYANSQSESWEGIEGTFEALKEHLARNGPYDGVVGFDMGAEVLLQAAQMAQAGDPGFQGKFRFMVLFTCGTAKHLSVLGRAGRRPSALLQVPAVISWSNGDENHPYQWYEETALAFAPEVREVIVHNDGHIPPRMKKGQPQLDRLARFLNCMREGRRFKPSDHEDNAWNREIWLPLRRVEPAGVPAGARKRLLVVHDPMGTHDYGALLAAQEEVAAANPLLRGRAPELYKSIGFPNLLQHTRSHLEVSGLTADSFQEAAAAAGISVEGLAYTEAHKSHAWHCTAEQVPSRALKREDIIDGADQEGAARRFADELLLDFSTEEGDAVGIVGIGTGAYLALAIAGKLMFERKVVPACFFAIDPPMRLPWSATSSPGALVDCPVRVLTHETSIVGPPWRWEVSTFGPFGMSTFGSCDEAVAAVVTEFQSL